MPIDQQTKEIWYLERGELWVHRPSWSFYIVPVPKSMPPGDDVVSSMGSRIYKVDLTELEPYRCNPFRVLWYGVVELYLILRSFVYLALVYTRLRKKNRSFEKFLNRRT